MAQTLAQTNDQARAPTISLTLGGGGARGLAHIHVIQAFEDLGLRPTYIVGTSIGAIFGASFASGLDANEILDHSLKTLGSRTGIAKKLFLRNFDSLKDLWNIGTPRRSLLNPEALLDIVFPKHVAKDFEQLKIPLHVVTTDYYEQETVVLSSGKIVPAVAASIALPAIFQPLSMNGRVLIDGGFSNPLPFDVINQPVDISIAIDVTGGPEIRPDKSLPSATEVLFTASHILQNTIIKEKLKTQRPDILLRPNVSHVPVLAFHKINEILEDTKGLREEVKRALEKSLKNHAG